MTENVRRTGPEGTEALQEDDYTGEDGLLYCGKCHMPKEAYFPDRKIHFGLDRHPSECRCQKEEREKREAEEEEHRHRMEVERLKSVGLPDRAMLKWTFGEDNGKNHQMNIARTYVEKWDQVRMNNVGLLLWGKVGTGKSFFAGCIANELMNREIPVCMTNFGTILNDLSMNREGKNEYIAWLCRFSLLILDDFGMERGTEYGLEQVYNVIDSRYRSGRPLIVTTNLALDELQNPGDTAHTRIYDRVLSMCCPVCFTGVNFRKEKAKNNMGRLKEFLENP